MNRRQDMGSNGDALAMQAIGQQLHALLDAESPATLPRGADMQAGEKETMPLQATNTGSFEEQVQAQLARIGAQLERLGQRLDEERGFSPQRPEEVPGYAELKTALHNLVEHLELAEGRTAEAISHLHEKLEDVAQRTTQALQLAQTQGGIDGTSLQALEERLETLNARLSDLQHNSEQRLRAHVDSILGDINARLEKVEQAPGNGMSPEDIARLVREQVQEHSAQAAQQTEARMASMVARLQGKLEELAAGVMDIDRLRTEVEQLDTQVRALHEQVANKADRSETDALKERMDALAAQLAAAHGDAPVDDTRLHALEEQVLQVRQLVEEALGEPLRIIDDRLASHEQQLTQLQHGGVDGERLARLEQTIAQLQQALQEGGQLAGPAGEDDGAGKAEISALRAGLADVEKFARESDSKTREMLQAVQETLTQVVERLITLEEARNASIMASGDRQRAAQGDAAAALLGEPAPEQAGSDVAQAVAAMAGAHIHDDGHAGADVAGSVDAGIAATGKRQQAVTDAGSSNSSDDLAAEVAQVVAGMKGAAPRQAETIRPLSGAESSSEAGTSPDLAADVDDFIAAARRAALAAASSNEAREEGGKRGKGLLTRLGGLTRRSRTAQAGEDEDPGAPEASHEDKRPRRFSVLTDLNRRKSGKVKSGKVKAASDAMQEQAAPDAESGKSGKATRSRLLLAGLVLLSAAVFIVNRQKAPDTPQVPSAAEQATSRQSSALQQSATPQQDEKSLQEPQSDAKKPAPQEKMQGAAGKQAAVPGNTGLFSPRGTGTPIMTSSIAAIGAAGAQATPSAGKPTGNNAATALPASIGPVALRQAALSGDGKAAYLVAMRYLKGAGVGRDVGKAAEWLRKAAENGVAVAMYRLGALYEQGAGLPKDPLQARVWYERAANRGNVRAMHNLAVMLASGKDGEPDFARAAHWFRKAAEHGVRDSQFNLAVLYHRGQGVQRSLAEAYFWYSAAAKQGDTAAAEQAKKLAAWLPAEERTRIEQRIAAFSPTPPVREANVVIIEQPDWRSANANDARLQTASLDAGRPIADKPLSGKALVMEVQRLLKKIGYDVGPVDGVMGNRTANAIRLFQLQSRLPINGRPDMALLQRLRQQVGSS